jgi:hypothetical protein
LFKRRAILASHGFLDNPQKKCSKKSYRDGAASAFRVLEQPRLMFASVIPQPACGMDTMRKITGACCAPSMIFLWRRNCGFVSYCNDGFSTRRAAHGILSLQIVEQQTAS